MHRPPETFRARLRECPLVAILRGVAPSEVEAIGEALVAEGIRIIEVPLNSPDPLVSIETLARTLGDRAMVGAGTVTSPGEVAQVRDAGGTLIVSPHGSVSGSTRRSCASTHASVPTARPISSCSNSVPAT